MKYEVTVKSGIFSLYDKLVNNNKDFTSQGNLFKNS